MNIHSAISKEVFAPRDERLLVAVEVWRRKRKRMSFLPPGAKGGYSTFLCVSVTNTKPRQLLITKVKQFGDLSSFIRRSQWTVEQLRQVDGINPTKDSPEFDLVFDNTVDQWITSSSADKCIFVQILYHACQKYWMGKTSSLVKPGKLSKASQHVRASQPAVDQGAAGPRGSPTPTTLQARRKSHVSSKQTEFINCQSKLTRDASTMNLFIYRCKAFFNRLVGTRPSQAGQSGHCAAGTTVTQVVQRMNSSLGKRGHSLTRAEDKTVELLHKAQQLADAAHTLSLKYSK